MVEGAVKVDDQPVDDQPAIDGILTILHSLQSRNPTQYVLNYDEDENRGGVTVNQLRNALFKVVKGRDKTLMIQRGSSSEFLTRQAGSGKSKRWEFDGKVGVVRGVVKGM